MTPTIATSRLILRPLTKPLTRNLAWLRNPDVVCFSEQRHREHTISTQLRYVNSFVGKSMLWAIQLAETGEHIGNISAAHDEPNDVSDIGILIGETSQWHKGYASEAWRATCNWLLDKDGGGIRKLEAGCARINLPMLKIIQASGFQQEGERLNHFLFDDHPVSMSLFGRFR